MTEPRETPRLMGQAEAERSFLEAYRSGRTPHAWLLAGPEGTGKATFAFLAARLILGGGSALAHDAGNPVHRRIAAGNEPGLTVLVQGVHEKTGKPRSAIPVDDIRALKRAMTLAPTEGGSRAVILDPAEAMNAAAANALLKLLEEPPERVVFFLVTHAPRRLLPTLLSRCRRLDFPALTPETLAAACEQAAGEPPRAEIVAAARGSAGAALALAAQEGAALRDAIGTVLAPLPQPVDRAALHALADTAAASGQDEAFRTVTRLIADLTARLATASAGADPPPEDLERLAPALDPAAAPRWAEATTQIVALTERVLALNLDRRQALLDMVARIETVAKGAG